MAINKDDLPTLDNAFRRLLTIASVKEGLFQTLISDIVDNATVTTPYTIYVDANGDDINNYGTKNKPFKTIQKAIDSVSGLDIQTSVRVLVGPGNFTGFRLGDISVNGINASLTIDGTLTTTNITGTGTGALSGGVGTVVITDNTKTWTPNEHQGKMIKAFLDGGTTAIYYMILANGTNTLTIGNNNAASYAYEIFTLDTVVDTPINSLGPVFAANDTLTSNSAMAGIVVSSHGSGVTQASQLTIRRMKISTPSNALRVSGSSNSIAFEGCWFNKTTNSGAVIANSGLGILTINRSLITAFGSAVGYSQGNSGVAGNVFFQGTGFCATTSSNSAVGVSDGSLSLNFCYFDGWSTGISCTYATLRFCSTNNFVNCSSGISLTLSSKAPVVQFCYFSNCANALTVTTKSYGSLVSSSVNNCTNGVVVSTGHCQVSSTTMNTVTNELTVEGVVYTQATLNGNSPKVVPSTPNAFGSYIWI